MLRFTGRMIATCAAVLIGVGLASSPLRADDVTTTKRVRFDRGSSSTTMRDSVKGYDTVRYEVDARAGQRLSVNLESRSSYVYFNVLNKRTDNILETRPTPREVTKWDGRLPDNGTYFVNVYLVRAEARRGSKADYKLSLSLSGNSDRPDRPGHDRDRFTEMDYDIGGSGDYTVNDRRGKKSVTGMRVQLRKDGSAQIDVTLDRDSFTLTGRWQLQNDNLVWVDIRRGFGSTSLTGRANVILRNYREFDRLDLHFVTTEQKTEHDLTFKVRR
ncbi:MAG: hypothetical protein JWN14_3171 [Chthonomonadales bacterium]|nr:hypothetical protein [Chthonomonadales bacterium]